MLPRPTRRSRSCILIRTPAWAASPARALLWRDEGKLDEAEQELRRGVGILTAKSNAAAPATLEASIDLAGVLAARGKKEEARQIIDRTEAPVMEKFADTAPARRAFDALRHSLAE